MSRVEFRRGKSERSKTIGAKARSDCLKQWDTGNDECSSQKSSCAFSPEHRCGQHCAKMDGHCGLLAKLCLTSGGKGGKKNAEKPLKKGRKASPSTGLLCCFGSPKGSSRASSQDPPGPALKASTRASSRSPSPPKRLMSVPLREGRPKEKKDMSWSKSAATKDSKRATSNQSRSASTNSRVGPKEVSAASLGKKTVLLVGWDGGELFEPKDKRAQLSGDTVSATVFAGGLRLGKDLLLVTGGVVCQKPKKKCEAVTFLQGGSVTVEKWAPLKKARLGHGMAELDETVAVFGGAKGGRHKDILRSVELWTGKRWEQGRAMKTARCFFATGKIQDKVLVASGQSANGVLTKLCEYYDPGQDQWHAFTDVSKGRMGVAGAAFCGRLWLSGGQDGPDSLTNRVDVFDPLSGKWEEVAPMTSHRAFHNLVEMKGQLVALGGDGGGYNDKAGTVELYDHRADAWRTIAHRLNPAPGSVAAVF